MEKFKLKNGEIRYRESYYLGNKKINSPSFHKKTDAKIWKKRVETERLSKLAQGDHYHKNIEVNFYEYAQQWLHSHVKTNCTHKTFLSYDSILRTHLYPVFKKLNLSEITEQQAMELMNNLKKTHKASVIKNIWIVLRSIINKAKREKYLFLDPIENIKKPKPDLRVNNFWIKTEINQFLLANRNDQLYPFYFIALHTGLRLGELCGLKWDRIDFVGNQISITRHRDGFGLKETTKTRISRHVPMAQEVRLILLRLFELAQENPYVFLEEDGSEIKYHHIYRRFHKAQKKAGIDHQITSHDMRHTFASNYMMNGGNVFDLQKLLGHTDIKMTMRYAHFTPDHLQGSLKFMDMTNETKIVIPTVDQWNSGMDNNLRMLGG